MRTRQAGARTRHTPHRASPRGGGTREQLGFSLALAFHGPAIGCEWLAEAHEDAVRTPHARRAHALPTCRGAESGLGRPSTCASREDHAAFPDQVSHEAVAKQRHVACEPRGATEGCG